MQIVYSLWTGVDRTHSAGVIGELRALSAENTFIDGAQ